MVIEKEFENEIYSKTLTDKQVVDLVKTYHDKIENSGFAPATRFTKMSRVNVLVKKYYPHLYETVKKTNIPPRIQKKSQIEERNKFNLQRLENRQEFTYDEIINAINNLKKSEDYYKLVVCILLSTGRRTTEVIARGNFENSKTPHHISFSGQLKTKDEVREAYEIPVLGMTPNALISLVDKIRNMKNYSDKSNEFIASRTNAYVNKAIRTALDRDDVTSETIRCIYAFIAYRLYGNPQISEAVYCSKILGHVGTPHTFVDNYNRIYCSGIGEESNEELRRQIAEKDTEIASLKKQIESLKTQLRNFKETPLKIIKKRMKVDD